MAIVASILTGAGALGSLGTGIAGAVQAGNADPGSQQDVSFPSLDPFANQITAQNAFDQSLALGFLDENSLLLASPLNRAIAEAQRRGLFGDGVEIGRIMRVAQRAVQNGIPTNSQQFRDMIRASFGEDGPRATAAVRAFESFANSSGFGSFEGLLRAHSDFVQSTQGRIDAARGTADTVFESRLQAREDIADLLGNLSVFGADEFDTFREGELTRLNRELDERETETLRRASILGINPGGAIGDLEHLRVDADLEATSRALALIGGRQAIEGNSLSLLQAGLGEPAPLDLTSPGAKSASGVGRDVNAGAGLLAASQGIGAITGDALANVPAITDPTTRSFG